MAITSVGYDGTVDEAQWASMVSKVGGYEYGIDKAGDFAVTQSAGTRMISIAAGLAWGRGVMDISDASAVIQLDAVATGARYDLIALRRNWGPANGGPTELVVIKGTSTKTIPSGRQASPGITDDQPLALVRVAAGSASIPEIIDLRVWGRNGGRLYAKDDLVRSYMNAVGTEININGVLWERIVGSNNTASWYKAGRRQDTGWQETTSGFASGWGGSIRYIQYRLKDGVVSIIMRFDRTGGTIATPAGNGNIDNVKIATVPAAIKPSKSFQVLSGGAAGPLASGHINNDGNIYLSALAPNEPIEKDRPYSLGGTYFID